MKQKQKTKHSQAKFYQKSERRQKGKARPNTKRVKTAEGVLSGTRHGYGFVKAEGLKEEIFIPASKIKGVYHGDRVLVSYTDTFGRGRIEGRIEKLVSVGYETAVGVLYSQRYRLHRQNFRECFLIPDDTRFGEALPIKETELPDGEKIEVLLSREKHKESYVVRSFGRADTQKANYEAILAGSGIRTEFPDEVLREADAVAAEPLPSGRHRVADFVMTIDGAGAKDLDDAVSVTKTENGWRLGVHIADVSYYVRRKSLLEKEATLRGTSVYFADKVVPMLPESLSNGVCSLNANEEKLTVSAYMTLSKNGEILKTELYESVIRSSLRGVYEEVNDFLLNEEASPYYEKYAPAAKTLKELCRLYAVLKKKRERSGMIDFDTADAAVILDQNGEPTDIVRRERGISERVIEQLMLTANEGVATLLFEKKIPTVYRLHEAPDSEKVRAFKEFIHAIGISAPTLSPENASPFAFLSVLEKAREAGKESAVSYAMLRTMQKAVYSADRHGHYGLSIPLYCHFTSPIRRLSDLALHRLIREHLFRAEPPRSALPYARRAAEAATEGEYRALAAERAILDLYKTVYMGKHVGEEYDAVVSSVTSFGIFAALPNTCEGIIPLGSLDGYYCFDEDRKALTGPLGVFRLGDRLRIRVKETDIQKSRVYFSLVALRNGEE